MLEHSQKQNIFFGPKYEELVAKSVSSKNKSKDLFLFYKNQGSSKEGKEKAVLSKKPPTGTRGNRGSGMFTAAGQTLQQYSAGGHTRGKNKFINSTLHQLSEPSVSIRILQNTSISIDFISSKNQATA